MQITQMKNTLLMTLFLLLGFSNAFGAGAGGVAYKLGPGDHIRIQITSEKDMLIDETIGESGSISYPFLGDVSVVGMTVTELDEYITGHLKGP